MPSTITVPDWMIISATRYALGRLSYIVSDTAQHLRRVWHSLEPQTRTVIKRDITEHLGSRMHVDGVDTVWRDLLTWIEKVDSTVKTEK